MHHNTSSRARRSPSPHRGPAPRPPSRPVAPPASAADGRSSPQGSTTHASCPSPGTRSTSPRPAPAAPAPASRAPRATPASARPAPSPGSARACSRASVTGFPSLAAADGSGALGPADVVVAATEPVRRHDRARQRPGREGRARLGRPAAGTLVSGVFPNPGPRVYADIARSRPPTTPTAWGLTPTRPGSSGPAVASS